MEKVFEWLTGGGIEAISTIVALLLSIISTVLTKILNKPASPVLATAIKLLGAGQFKDEDGKWSIPLTTKNL